MPKYTEQKLHAPNTQQHQTGAVHLLVLLGIVGLIAFFAIGSLAEFRSDLFSFLYPKPASQAAGVSVIVEAENGTEAGSVADVNDSGASGGKGLQFNANQRGGATVNVTSKGATPNDGTDDTAAFQAALDQVGTAGGGSVYVPAGKFNVGVMRIYSNTTLFGDYGNMQGSGSPSILELKDNVSNFDTRNYSMITPKNHESSNTPTVNVIVRDLKLLGNSMGQWDYYPNDGKKNGYPMGKFLNGAAVFDPGATGKVDGKDYWFCHPCSQFGVALHAADNWLVQRIWAEDFDGDGIYLGRASVTTTPGGSSDMNMVVDNVVRRNVRNGMMISDGDKNIIRNNLFEEDQIGLADFFPNNPSQQNTKNCDLIVAGGCNDGVMNPYTSGEFDLEPNFTNQQHGNQNIFENNTFQNGFYNGMQVTRQQAGMDRNQFIYNMFKNNKNQQMLIQSNGVSNTLIKGNHFINNPTQSSVRHLRIATSVDGTYIVGNQFIGGTGGVNSAESIKVDSAGAAAGPDLTVFENNTFDLTGGTGDGKTLKFVASNRNYFTGLNNTLLGGANISNSSGAFLTPPPPSYPYAEFPVQPVPSGCAGPLVSESNASTLTVNIPSAGDYRVWSRIMSSNSDNNSYYIKVDGNCPIRVGDMPSAQNNSWIWVDYREGTNIPFVGVNNQTNKITLNLSAGNHTVKLISNEAGAKLDSVLFTTDAACVPSGSTGVCGASSPTPTPTPTPTASSTPTPTPTPTASPTPTPSGSIVASFEAESGTITAPFTVSGGVVSQTTGSESDPLLGGKATYSVSIPTTGDYIVNGWVNGPNVASNSFFINFDAEPTFPVMIWDFEPQLTTGIEKRTVSWRGNALNSETAQFRPKVFNLTAGNHTMILRGRDPAGVDKFTVEKITTATPTPTPTPTATPAASVPAGTSYLSDLTYTVVANGFGPAEKDKSNGNNAAGDGNPITLNGVAFAKGIGVHAYSEITYNAANKCSNFSAVVGADDEDGGTVIFQVYGDGTKLFDSAFMDNNSANMNVSVNISGVNTLKLVVTDGGNGVLADHADWADAKIVCSTSTPTPTPTATPTPTPTPTPATPTPTPTASAGPGDVNGDKVVNVFDYNILLTNFGKTGTNLQGDIAAPFGKVDIFDYNLLMTNFGKTYP